MEREKEREKKKEGDKEMDFRKTESEGDKKTG